MTWIPLCPGLIPLLPILTPSNLYFIKPDLIPTEWNCVLLMAVSVPLHTQSTPSEETFSPLK